MIELVAGTRSKFKFWRASCTPCPFSRPCRPLWCRPWPRRVCPQPPQPPPPQPLTQSVSCPAPPPWWLHLGVCGSVCWDGEGTPPASPLRSEAARPCHTVTPFSLPPSLPPHPPPYPHTHTYIFRRHQEVSAVSLKPGEVLVLEGQLLHYGWVVLSGASIAAHVCVVAGEGTSCCAEANGDQSPSRQQCASVLRVGLCGLCVLGDFWAPCSFLCLRFRLCEKVSPL